MIISYIADNKVLVYCMKGFYVAAHPFEEITSDDSNIGRYILRSHLPENRSLQKSFKGFKGFKVMTSLTDSSYRYTRLYEPSSSAEFFADTLQKQQIILNDQDKDLEKVGDSVQLLKDMSSRIGTELEEQSIMLDELSTDMERTGMKLNEMVKKIAKVTNMNDDKRQWMAIFILSIILFIIVLLFVLL
ncbi:unnamed protein product [Litomosoides sigmodontis]|uniref:t-SNARE coiled-coil homology domain-containing protein n=1 Tax=Litomosoides sigmodontis TaxID=42156 RepID=A0A3P6T335_LITSI|nr:unnamed protein product [Litomosoides sigmodontis]